MELVRIPGGVDFDVPVEFKFLNGVGAGGALGASWRFPQLESALIPRGRGVFEWRMPNGGGMALLPSKQDEGAVYSEDGQWRARWTGRTATVENQERWRYTYVDGRLERVTAPSGRFLAVVWQGKRCVGMELHDEVAGKVFPLASFRYFTDGKLSEVEIGGKIS